MLIEISKLEAIRAIGLPADLFDGVDARMLFWAHVLPYGEVKQAQHDPTHRPQRRPDRRDLRGVELSGLQARTANGGSRPTCHLVPRSLTAPLLPRVKPRPRVPLPAAPAGRQPAARGARARDHGAIRPMPDCSRRPRRRGRVASRRQRTRPAAARPPGSKGAGTYAKPGGSTLTPGYRGLVGVGMPSWWQMTRTVPGAMSLWRGTADGAPAGPRHLAWRAPSPM